MCLWKLENVFKAKESKFRVCNSFCQNLFIFLERNVCITKFKSQEKRKDIFNLSKQMNCVKSESFKFVRKYFCSVWSFPASIISIVFVDIQYRRPRSVNEMYQFITGRYDKIVSAIEGVNGWLCWAVNTITSRISCIHIVPKCLRARLLSSLRTIKNKLCL